LPRRERCCLAGGLVVALVAAFLAGALGLAAGLRPRRFGAGTGGASATGSSTAGAGTISGSGSGATTTAGDSFKPTAAAFLAPRPRFGRETFETDCPSFF